MDRLPLPKCGDGAIQAQVTAFAQDAMEKDPTMDHMAKDLMARDRIAKGEMKK